jgi:D-threo-aldose 1-dehydrogenase
MNAAVLGGGMLASRAADRLYGYRPARPEVRAAAQALHDLADELRVSLPDAAVQHSLRDPRVDVTVVGFSKPERVAALLTSLATPVPDAFWERAAALAPDPAAWLDAAGS